MRPQITAPAKIGYNGTFDVGTSADVSRVTLVRNGSVTHGFNNDQNFQDLTFTKTASGVTIDAPRDGTYAPPGAYMLFVFDANGTPSVADIVQIDPTVAMDVRTPRVVDQFEYPRVPTEWRSANPPAVVDVAPGNGRMLPWQVRSQVQLVRAAAASNGGLGLVGYHLALGTGGDLERSITGLDPGREYRISMRYARDSRSAATAGPGTARVDIGSLDAALTATAEANPSQSGRVSFATYTGTFTAGARSETLTLAGSGGAGMMIDDLVIVSSDPSSGDMPVHYEFEEGSGTSAANTGNDGSVGAATLTGATTFTAADGGIFGRGVDLPGGANANAVDLPDDLLQGQADFTTSFWVKPDTKADWIGLFHIGDGLGGDGSFFQIQMQTNAAGATGLAATFKAKGDALQERVYAVPTKDVVANRWNHVAFTRQGATGTLYLDGQVIASRDDLTIDMTDIGPTANNWLGRNGFPDPALDGAMDEVRVYTSTLTAAEVAGLYAEGSSVRTTTAITVDPASPVPFGTDPVVTATVTPTSGTAPAAGTAQLLVDGVAQGSAVPLDAQGRATFPALVDPAPGTRQVQVVFTAADGFRDSSASTSYVVERPPPGPGVPVHYEFDETTGTAAANSGTDTSVGAATLTGTAAFAPGGRFGGAVDLPGGGGDYVDLPNDLTAGLTDEFTVSLWAKPDQLRTWSPVFQIGTGTDTFFLLQSQTQAGGNSGFAATFKASGLPAQERLVLGLDSDPTPDDLTVGRYTHVVFTMSGGTGRMYFDGQLVGERTDFTLGMDDVGVAGSTVDNYIGNNDYPDPTFDGLIDDVRLYGYELSAEQVQTLFAGPQNAAPVATADAYSTDEGSVLTVPAPGVLANDTDADGDTLTATGVTQPTNGAVTLGADGALSYTPKAGFSGTDVFTYTAHDGEVASAATQVTVTVRKSETPTPVATEVTAVAESVVYGKPSAVAAVIRPATATGNVEVRKGTTVLGTAAVDAGGATVTLPAKSLLPGDHLLAVRYLGDRTHDASTTFVQVTIRKVTPAMTVGAPKKARKGEPTFTVTLTAPDGVPVEGEVEGRISSGGTTRGTLSNGTVVLTLPKGSKSSGTMDVVYLGSDLAASVRQTLSYKVS